ncbi:hypothetical protein KAU13_04830, partial [candidate division WOR-3 bacterium]|nr:hypothetical protein [candidate division WOR-3 bacterium]
KPAQSGPATLLSPLSPPTETSPSAPAERVENRRNRPPLNNVILSCSVYLMGRVPLLCSLTSKQSNFGYSEVFFY